VTSYEKTRNSEKATMDYKDVALELFSLWAKTGKG
jgi:chromosome partitioning protein